MKKTPKDSVRTETNKKMESTNKTKIKNKSPKRTTIIMKKGEIEKRKRRVKTLKAEKITFEILSMMTSLSLATEVIGTMVEVREDVEEIEGEVMEEEDIGVDHQCKTMEVGQVPVTTEAATSTIEEMVATKEDLWITTMDLHTE